MAVSDLTSIIGRLLPEPAAGLLAGILFGTKATLSGGLYDDLIKTGTLHVIALSGMNITIVEKIVCNSLLRFVSRRIASLLTIVVIIGYILFVGPSPSVVRAGIMGSMSLIAVWMGREMIGIFALVTAGFVMVLFDPALVGNLSFQLSFLATFGMLIFGKQYVRKKDRQTSDSFPRYLFFQMKQWVTEEFQVTASAQVLTIPLIFLLFHRISLISPLTNMLIGWTMMPVTILGFITIAVGSVSVWLAQFPAWLTWVILQYDIAVIHMTALIPFSSLGW